jgi:hypothetical protein
VVSLSTEDFLLCILAQHIGGFVSAQDTLEPVDIPAPAPHAPGQGNRYSNFLSGLSRVGVKASSSGTSLFNCCSCPVLIKRSHSVPVIIVTIFMIGLLLSVIVDVSVPGVLPLVDMDYLELNVQDTLSYISAYCLRRYFNFECLLNEKKLHPNDVHPLGEYIVVDAFVALLTDHFPYLTKNQLILLTEHKKKFTGILFNIIHVHQNTFDLQTEVLSTSPFI